MTIFWCKFGFKKWFGASSQFPATELVITTCIKSTFIKPFHLSNLLQMLNDYKMVNDEFFSNFSRSCKRISFDDCSLLTLSTSDEQSICPSSSSLLSPLQNFLNHHWTTHSLAVPGPNVLLMLQVVTDALWPILNSKKEIAGICFCLTLIL